MEVPEIHLINPESKVKPRWTKKPRVWKECILCGNEFRTIEQEVCQDCRETKKYQEYMKNK